MTSGARAFPAEMISRSSAADSGGSQRLNAASGLLS